ncbi:MAG: DUF308 domain-containing protein [Clostridia bacterium]|nr:DUF308 domain-containing protein [Clostridia bacterium]
MTADRFEILQEIARAITDVKPEADVAGIAPETSLTDDLGLDPRQVRLLSEVLSARFGVAPDPVPQTVGAWIARVAQTRRQPARAERTARPPLFDFEDDPLHEPTSDPVNEKQVLRAKTQHIAASVLMLLAGVFVIGWPHLGDAVRWVVSSVFVLVGFTSLFGYFSNDLYRLAFQYDLAFGAFSAIFGVLCYFLPDRQGVVFLYGVCVYVLIDGLIKLQTAVEARRFGLRRWSVLLGTAIAVVTVAVTSFLLIFCGRNEGHKADYLLGVALALDGIENVWNTLYTVRIRADLIDRER